MPLPDIFKDRDRKPPELLPQAQTLFRRDDKLTLFFFPGQMP
jgi:hypothetical protein